MIEIQLFVADRGVLCMTQEIPAASATHATISIRRITNLQRPKVLMTDLNKIRDSVRQSKKAVGSRT